MHHFVKTRHFVIAYAFVIGATAFCYNRWSSRDADCDDLNFVTKTHKQIRKSGIFEMVLSFFFGITRS